MRFLPCRNESRACRGADSKPRVLRERVNTSDVRILDTQQIRTKQIAIGDFSRLLIGKLSLANLQFRFLNLAVWCLLRPKLAKVYQYRGFISKSTWRYLRWLPPKILADAPLPNPSVIAQPKSQKLLLQRAGLQ